MIHIELLPLWHLLAQGFALLLLLVVVDWQLVGWFFVHDYCPPPLKPPEWKWRVALPVSGCEYGHRSAALDVRCSHDRQFRTRPTSNLSLKCVLLLARPMRNEGGCVFPAVHAPHRPRPYTHDYKRRCWSTFGCRSGGRAFVFVLRSNASCRSMPQHTTLTRAAVQQACFCVGYVSGFQFFENKVSVRRNKCARRMHLLHNMCVERESTPARELTSFTIDHLLTTCSSLVACTRTPTSEGRAAEEVSRVVNT
jgi:hypothetical protein